MDSPCWRDARKRFLVEGSRKRQMLPPVGTQSLDLKRGDVSRKHCASRAASPGSKRYPSTAAARTSPRSSGPGSLPAALPLRRAFTSFALKGGEPPAVAPMITGQQRLSMSLRALTSRMVSGSAASRSAANSTEGTNLATAFSTLQREPNVSPSTVPERTNASTASRC